MFKINRKTDYAVRVCVALARRPWGARLSTQSIQEEMLIPRPFLQRIIAELSQAGLLHTNAGPNGGLQLARPPEDITLRDILQVMEGPLCLSDCLVAPQECPLSTECPVRSRWGRLQTIILMELERTTLRQLVEDVFQYAGFQNESAPLPLSGQPVVLEA
jgi:Rrf2 family protein